MVGSSEGSEGGNGTAFLLSLIFRDKIYHTSADVSIFPALQNR